MVEVNNRSEKLDTLNEQELTNLLVRLMRSSEHLVMALDGHGEGRLNKPANYDLGDLGAKLEAQGFRTGSVNFAVAQDIPDNASVLVIASPRVDLLPGEVNRIKRYLEKGGNLLWLVDYDSVRGMGAIADFLGLDLIDGVIVDPAAGAQKAAADNFAGFRIRRACHYESSYHEYGISFRKKDRGLRRLPRFNTHRWLKPLPVAGWKPAA